MTQRCRRQLVQIISGLQIRYFVSVYEVMAHLILAPDYKQRMRHYRPP